MNAYDWYYILYVPLDALAAADAVAPNLNNPSGIEATFQPVYDGQENLTGYIADFLATEDGAAPSKALLEGALSGNPALASIKWWRMDNEHKPGNYGAILRAHHADCTGCTIGQSWSIAQAIAALGYA